MLSLRPCGIVSVAETVLVARSTPPWYRGRRGSLLAALPSQRSGYRTVDGLCPQAHKRIEREMTLTQNPITQCVLAVWNVILKNRNQEKWVVTNSILWHHGVVVCWTVPEETGPPEPP